MRWRILDAWAEAAEQAGIPRIKDFNSGNNEGSSYFQVNQRSGVRWNTAKAFLRPRLQRKNLSVLTNATVERLVDEGSASTGVHASSGAAFPLHDRRQARGDPGRRRDRLAADPATLRASARPTGCAASASRSVHDCRASARTCRTTCRCGCAYKVSGVRDAQRALAQLVQKARIGLEYALRRTGPMTMAPSQLGTFAGPIPRARRPTCSITCSR